MPNKSDALVYMDGEEAAAPTRYARAVLDVRATENAYFQELRVGPLPLVNGTTTWEPVDYTWTRKTGGRVRNLVPDVDIIHEAWIYKIGASVADITLDLWGLSMTGSPNDTLINWGIDPPFEVGNRFLRWDQFWRVYLTLLL
jgi:primary-amine oxidase